MTSRPYLPVATLAIAISILYLFQLDGVGVLGPDEPRYAAIGRSMAFTRDFVTPRLWGVPWFEKPPLLYWTTALGTRLGLGPDLCGRVPVVLLSLAFLGWSAWFLTREYSLRIAVAAASLLATCAGWLAFSSLCLTDVPLAVCFSVAVFLALPLLRPEPERRGVAIRFLWVGVFIGLAILAKGLVPIALAVPFAWYLRPYWKQWWIAVASALAVSLPWYALVYARNGYPFIQEFFIRHHFERLYSVDLLHVQPWYYYFPVLLGALFPWTPLLLLLRPATIAKDRRQSFLFALLVFGFFFFSLSRNKLPGYLLPLLPACFILIAAAAFDERRLCELPKGWLLSSAALIAAIPLLAPVLPQSLLYGRVSAASLPAPNATELFYVVVPVAAVLLAPRLYAPPLLVLTAVAGALFLKAADYPAIDDNVSPRTLWRETADRADETCDGGTNRDWLWGLSYYRGRSYPPCGNGVGFRYALRTHHRGAPDLEPLGR